MTLSEVEDIVFGRIQNIKEAHFNSVEHYCWEHISFDVKFDTIDIELEVGRLVPNLEIKQET